MSEKTVLDAMSDDATATLKAFEDALSEIGPYVVEAKKTTLHFRPTGGIKPRPAFAGARAMRSGLRLTLVMRDPPRSARVAKSEKVSASRWHVEIVLQAGEAVDGDLSAWLGEAYALQSDSR